MYGLDNAQKIVKQAVVRLKFKQLRCVGGGPAKYKLCTRQGQGYQIWFNASATELAPVNQ